MDVQLERERVLKVLIADDDALVRELLGAVLEAGQFELVFAEDGLSALEAVKDSRPDCVILDLMMPGMDGLSVCEAIRKDPDIAGVRVVMLTANALATRGRWREAGVDAMLTKPFGALDLMDAITGSTAGDRT
ncbi:MAG: response regulator [Actinomycetota bacterium]